jgi:poly(3-hydroxybutyrate) depolymerase
MNRRAICACAIAAVALVAAGPGRAEDGPETGNDASRTAVRSLHAWLSKNPDGRPPIDGQDFASVSLTRADAVEARTLLWKDHVRATEAAVRAEWERKSIRIGERVMRFDYRTFGRKPEDGWDLFISMHGGGGAPKAVNDAQWRNQVRLYQPKQGLYVAPRAPTDTWNLWHQAHIDGLFDRLIEGAVIAMGANTDRVYLMGYSAGGDGVYQLAPRMADRWAAAAMMAGHPNEASPLGLRNIGFTIHVGGNDGGYKRNQVAAAWKEKLATLRAGDPEGYAHEVHIHPGLGHWMNRKDAAALAWMATFTRTPYPARVVWRQDDVTHARFYWLAVPGDRTRRGAEVVASRDGQAIVVARAADVDALTIRLNDDMLDLDRAVTVRRGGETLFSGVVPRTIAVLDRTLQERRDPRLVFSAQIDIELK